MGVAFLDIIVETLEGVSFEFRVPIDNSTADRMRRYTVKTVKLVHCLDVKTVRGGITPTHDLSKFNIKGE